MANVVRKQRLFVVVGASRGMVLDILYQAAFYSLTFYCFSSQKGSPPKIPGNSALIFQMEILEIQGDKVEALKCNPETLKECNDKEQGYVRKMKAKASDQVEKELKRLTEMMSSKMKPELQQWISRRLNILKQMVEPNTAEEL
jgi:FKBP-type peptidyl-prolyl cis-trans isomerase